MEDAFGQLGIYARKRTGPYISAEGFRCRIEKECLNDPYPKPEYWRCFASGAAC